MQAERWESVKSVFLAALATEPSRRTAYLAEACAGTPEIEREVTSLLEWHGRAAGVWETPAAAELDAGRLAGPYRIIREIGRGGMGSVYLAERTDGAFDKPVAIKVVKAGLDGDDSLRRFRRERDVLARLEHPNIAGLLDGGQTTGGRPYLVMEYVDGVPIHRYCHEQGLATAERVRIFLGVCDAVQHAHRNLIIHRDLKPANILVNTEGAAKLLDFGIAKLLEEDGHTRTGQRFFTPGYSSPEQLRGDPLTTASDIYSLGAVLRAIVKDSIASEADLAAMVAMAMRDEPLTRYESVAQMADDLRRYLDGRPVAARRLTPLYQASRFLRRHKTPVLAALAVMLVTAAGAWTALRERARTAERTRSLRAMAISMMAEVDRANLPLEARRELADRALSQLEALTREGEADVELRVELFSAHNRAARVTEYVNGPGAGLDHWRRAEAILEGLLASDPSDVLLDHLATTRRFIAAALASTGRLPEAINLNRQEAGIAEQLLERKPGNINYQDHLARGYRDLARMLAAAGKRDEARTWWRKRLALGQRMWETRRAAPQLETMAESLAGLLLSGGSAADGATVTHVVARGAEDLESTTPAGSDLFSLARTSEHLAEIQRAAGRVIESRRFDERASAMLDRLAAQGGSDLWSADVVLTALAANRERAGQPDRALAAHRRALTIRQARWELGQHAFSVERALAETHFGIATILSRQGQRAEARRHAEGAKRHYAACARLDPANTEVKGRLERLAELS